MTNTKRGTIEYVIKKANPIVYGGEGFVVETAQPLGKFFKSLNNAKRWCETKADKFRLEATITIIN